MTDEERNPPPQRRNRTLLLAERLAQIRRERNLSQGAMGDLVGASQATVSRWEDPHSTSAPSALELAEIAEVFGVDLGWLVGSTDERDRLPAGAAVIDQAMLNSFAEATTAPELRRLLGQDLSFGTIWVQVPVGAEVATVQEAMRRVREVDRRVRELHPELWQEWAALVLR